MGLPILGTIVDGIKSVFGFVDELHTSAEEKLEIKTRLLAIHSSVLENTLAYESRIAEAQARIIESEAKSEHWLTSAWRPLTMIVFVGLVVWYYMANTFEWPKPETAFVSDLFGLIKLGLGGYVIGRSGEKIVSGIVGVMKAREEA